MLVDEVFARRVWGDTDPIGQMLRVGYIHGNRADAAEHTVIGVVRHIEQGAVVPEQDREAQLILPAEPSDSRMHVYVRGAAIAEVAERVEAIAVAVGSPRPTRGMTNYGDRAELATAQYRFLSAVLGILATVGGVLSALGLYTTLSFAVATRTREIDGTARARGPGRSGAETDRRPIDGLRHGGATTRLRCRRTGRRALSRVPVQPRRQSVATPGGHGGDATDRRRRGGTANAASHGCESGDGAARVLILVSATASWPFRRLFVASRTAAPASMVTLPDRTLGSIGCAQQPGDHLCSSLDVSYSSSRSPSSWQLPGDRNPRRYPGRRIPHRAK